MPDEEQIPWDINVFAEHLRSEEPTMSNENFAFTLLSEFYRQHIESSRKSIIDICLNSPQQTDDEPFTPSDEFVKAVLSEQSFLMNIIMSAMIWGAENPEFTVLLRSLTQADEMFNSLGRVIYTLYKQSILVFSNFMSLEENNAANQSQG